MTPEFGLIANYFSRPVRVALLGGGDDCALLPPTALATAVSTDTLVSGVHFFHDVSPESLGHKVLAVSLSDLAAMGARPRAFTLALTLPSIDEQWLERFSSGLYAIADDYEIELVGGDTTRGPLSITVTVMGEVDAMLALRRDGAKPLDDIWVSGSIGGAALALHAINTNQVALAQMVVERLERPIPRVALGQRLKGLASAAIDISDGLIADLGHIAERSSLGALVHWPLVPIHAELVAQEQAVQVACALAGGDDYELCFTAAPEFRETIAALARPLGISLARIGQMSADHGQVCVLDGEGNAMRLASAGFDHFSNRET